MQTVFWAELWSVSIRQRGTEDLNTVCYILNYLFGEQNVSKKSTRGHQSVQSSRGRHKIACFVLQADKINNGTNICWKYAKEITQYINCLLNSRIGCSGLNSTCDAEKRSFLLLHSDEPRTSLSVWRCQTTFPKIKAAVEVYDAWKWAPKNKGLRWLIEGESLT